MKTLRNVSFIIAASALSLAAMLSIAAPAEATGTHQQPPSCSMQVAPESIVRGDNAVLIWTSTNATAASIDKGVGSVSLDGQKSVSPTQTTTYTLKVTNSYGTYAECSATVEVTEPPAPSCNIWADDESVDYGDSTTLKWDSDHADSATLTQFGGVALVGDRPTGALFSDKTYTLTVMRGNKSAQCHVDIHVGDQPKSPPSCGIWADPSNVNYDGSTTLHWTSTGDADSAKIDQGIGSVSLSGTHDVYNLTSDRTYTMTVNNSGGERTCETRVYVKSQNHATSCWITLSNSNNNSYNYQYDYNQYGYNNNVPYNNSYNYSNQATLSWGSDYATLATISPNIGSVSTDGSRTVYTDGVVQYTMTVYGSGGSAQCHTQNYYPSVNSLYCNITASPNNVRGGQSTVLSWSSTGAHSAFLQDGGAGTVSSAGSLAVWPASSRTYTLTVRDYQGRTQTCQAYVSVINNPIIPVSVAPYVALTQIPYTGFGDGLGGALYWLSVMSAAGAGLYLLSYYRGLNFKRSLGMGK